MKHECIAFGTCGLISYWSWTAFGEWEGKWEHISGSSGRYWKAGGMLATVYEMKDKYA